MDRSRKLKLVFLTAAYEAKDVGPSALKPQWLKYEGAAIAANGDEASIILMAAGVLYVFMSCRSQSQAVLMSRDRVDCPWSVDRGTGLQGTVIEAMGTSMEEAMFSQGTVPAN